MRRFMMAALMALPFCTAAASAAPHQLGITGVSTNKGFRITDVKADTNADVLQLKKGDVINAIGNPAGGLPMAKPKTRKDIEDVMKSCGDHILMFVSNGTDFKVVEGDLDADAVVSLPSPGVGDADGVVLVARSAGRHSYEKYLQNKPTTVSKMLNRHKKGVVKKNLPRVVPGTVKHKQEKKPNWLAKNKARKAAKSARTAPRGTHRAALALPARTEV